MEEQNEKASYIECSTCKSSNPEGKKYCGDCGAFLDGAIGPVKEYLDTNLRAQVIAVLKEHYKDQKILESEIAEGVATKLSSWAKLLAFFVGIPLGILVITLGAIGIKNYFDFMVLVSNAKKDTEQRVEAARKEGEIITTQYQSLKDQLAQATSLANDVKVLTVKVNQISEKIGFVPTAALTPDLKNQLESSLSQFQKHLQEMGYKGTEGGIRISINPQNDKFGPAYYVNGTIQVEAAFATDTDVLFREYSHHVLMTSARGKFVDKFMGLESGLASYLSSSFNGDPAFGEKSVTAMSKKYGEENSKEFINKGSIHNLKNNRKFSDLQINPLDTTYIPAEVWGGVFWDIRESLGQEYTDRLLFQTWQSLEGKDVTGDLPLYFYKRLVEVNKSLGGENQLDQIREIFKRRGLSL
jgi:hypothetical protein